MKKILPVLIVLFVTESEPKYIKCSEIPVNVTGGWVCTMTKKEAEKQRNTPSGCTFNKQGLCVDNHSGFIWNIRKEKK